MTEERPMVTTTDSDIDVVTRYVHILLSRMVQDGRFEMVLNAFESLPNPFVPAPDQLPEKIDYSSVVGRLQAITHGEEPNVEYAATSQCEIRFNGCPHQLVVDVQDGSCTVRLTREE